MMTYHVRFLLLVVAGWVTRQQQDVIDYLREENRVLRAGLRGKRLRLSDEDRRRLAVKAQALGRDVLAQIASVATPSTLLRWYRCLIAAKYDGSKNRSPGRPPTAKDIRELMVRMARENPTWGYTRLQGALKNLGYELGRNTIKRVLAEHGIAPAPERGKSMSWSTFITEPPRHRQRAHHTSAGKREGRWPHRVARATWRHSQLLLPCRLDCGRDGSPSMDSTGVAWKHSFRNTLGYSLSTRWSSAW